MKNRGGFTALHLCCQVSFKFDKYESFIFYKWTNLKESSLFQMCTESSTFYKCAKKVSPFKNVQRKFHFLQMSKECFTFLRCAKKVWQMFKESSSIFNFRAADIRPSHYLAAGVGLAVNQIWIKPAVNQIRQNQKLHLFWQISKWHNADTPPTKIYRQKCVCVCVCAYKYKWTKI